MTLLIADLLETHAGVGQVMWMGVRPGRKVDVRSVAAVDISMSGLEGDRRTKPGKRAVTLIQWEHLPAIAALAHCENVMPEMLRRNVAVSGINLLALRKAEFKIGDVTLRGNGLCAPCSRMEEVLGPGGYNAMRGHGGICAEVVSTGRVEVGNEVFAL